MKRLLMAAGTVVALALVGCGGSGEQTIKVTSDDLVPSRNGYIVDADTICANTTQSIKTEAEARFRIDSRDFTVTPSGEVVFKPGRRPSSRQIEAFGEEVIVPAFRDQLADLRALTAPSGDEATVRAIFAAAQRGVDELQSDPAIFDDSAAVRRKLSEARRLGRRYGFFDCGTYSAP